MDNGNRKQFSPPAERQSLDLEVQSSELGMSDSVIGWTPSNHLYP